jgi:hypothetical protein
MVSFDRPTASATVDQVVNPETITTLYRRQCNTSRSLRLMSAMRVNSGTSPDPFNRSHDPGRACFPNFLARQAPWRWQRLVRWVFGEMQIRLEVSCYPRTATSAAWAKKRGGVTRLFSLQCTRRRHDERAHKDRWPRDEYRCRYGLGRTC